MITRKIEKEITRFCNSTEKKVLLITGARQDGNKSTQGKVIYYPIYMLMFVQKKNWVN